MDALQEILAEMTDAVETSRRLRCRRTLWWWSTGCSCIGVSSRRSGDVSVYLDAPCEITIARMAARDGTSVDPYAPQSTRYMAGQQLCLDECQPAHLATLVLDTVGLTAPQVVPGVDLDPR